MSNVTPIITISDAVDRLTKGKKEKCLTQYDMKICHYRESNPIIPAAVGTIEVNETNDGYEVWLETTKGRADVTALFDIDDQMDFLEE